MLVSIHLSFQNSIDFIMSLFLCLSLKPGRRKHAVYTSDLNLHLTTTSRGSSECSIAVHSFCSIPKQNIQGKLSLSFPVPLPTIQRGWHALLGRHTHGIGVPNHCMGSIRE
ncbi:hypothetical protein DAI22_03g104750 [Oryza sativa Japonica Group]|nr:hypothetical protein DAI22_03g104750 [Oryza sativa Japonica Group]